MQQAKQRNKELKPVKEEKAPEPTEEEEQELEAAAKEMDCREKYKLKSIQEKIKKRRMMKDDMSEYNSLLDVHDGLKSEGFDPITTETLRSLERVPVAFNSPDYKPLSTTRVNFGKYKNIEAQDRLQKAQASVSASAIPNRRESASSTA